MPMTVTLLVLGRAWAFLMIVCTAAGVAGTFSLLIILCMAMVAMTFFLTAVPVALPVAVTFVLRRVASFLLHMPQKS